MKSLSCAALVAALATAGCASGHARPDAPLTAAPAKDEALAIYKQRYLSGRLLVDRWGDGREVVYEGEFQKKLGRDEFYERVMDAELQARLDAERLWGHGLVGGATVLSAAVAGTAVGFMVANPRELVAPTITLAVASGVFVPAATSWAMLTWAPFDLLSPDEVRARIAGFNEKLRADLGLAKADVALATELPAVSAPAQPLVIPLVVPLP